MQGLQNAQFSIANLVKTLMEKVGFLCKFYLILCKRFVNPLFISCEML